MIAFTYILKMPKLQRCRTDWQLLETKDGCCDYKG